MLKNSKPCFKRDKASNSDAKFGQSPGSSIIFTSVAQSDSNWARRIHLSSRHVTAHIRPSISAWSAERLLRKLSIASETGEIFIIYNQWVIANENICVGLKICGDMVPKKQDEEHFLNTHAPVPCSMCKETITRDAFDSYKGEVFPKRIVTCELCEFPLPVVDLAEHQEVCGNRTKLCYQCNNYVRLRETYNHETICPGTVLNNVESSRRISGATEGDGNGRKRRGGNGVSKKRLFFTVAITGITVLLGSLFFQKKPEGG